MDPAPEGQRPEPTSQRLDIPPHSDFGGCLIAIAWAACGIGVGYALVYMIGMAMRVSGRGPDIYETFATSVWFMISAVAILIYAKRHRPGPAALILLVLPGAVTALGLLFALPNLMVHPLAALLILFIPAAAALLDLRIGRGRNSSWALESVLAATLILTSAWILAHGPGFEGSRSQRRQEAAAFLKQRELETLFTSLTPSIQEALPKEVGTWRLVESIGPEGSSQTLSMFAKEAWPRIEGRCDLLYARYEDSASKPYDAAQAQVRFEEHAAKVKARLAEVAQELEATEGNDTSIGMSDQRSHRRLVLESELTALQYQEHWNVNDWQKWDEKEKIIEVWIHLWAPGQVIQYDGGMFHPIKEIPAAPPGVILPWDDPFNSDRYDHGRQESCVLGQWGQSPVRSPSDGRMLFVFTSLGISVNPVGNDASRMDQFIKGFDLSRLVDITRKTPVASLQTH